MRSKLLLGLLGLLPALAWSHTTHQIPGADFSAGLTHVLTGLDHLAAIWCLGALATSCESRPTSGRVNSHHWLWLPVLFFTGLIGGGVFGGNYLTVSAEPVIAASIVFWSGLVVLRKQLPVLVQALACTVFALFHGAAHSAQFMDAQQPLAAWGGLLLASAVIFCLGFVITRSLNDLAGRITSGIVGIIGLSFWAQALT